MASLAFIPAPRATASTWAAVRALLRALLRVGINRGGAARAPAVREKGGDPELVLTVALWGVAAGHPQRQALSRHHQPGAMAHNWYGWIRLAGRPRDLGGILGGVIRRADTAAQSAREHPAVPRCAPRHPLRAGDRARRQTTSTRSCSGNRANSRGRSKSAPAHRPAAFAALDLRAHLPLRADLRPRAPRRGG